MSEKLGIGLGLRLPHLRHILERKPDIGWLEVLGDNHLDENHWSTKSLEKIRADYAMTLHTVGMSIGSSDPLDFEYLSKVRELGRRLEVAWYSDHLSWTSVHGIHLHTLLPLPYTIETVQHVSGRIHQIQEYLGKPLVIENVSSYLRFSESGMQEWEFIDAITKACDCELLLDISNVVVNSTNQNFDALQYVSRLPRERIRQFHLGGYEEHSGYVLDTHSDFVSQKALELYQYAINCIGDKPLIIEWDSEIPDLEVLLKERQRILDVRNMATASFVRDFHQYGTKKNSGTVSKRSL